MKEFQNLKVSSMRIPHPNLMERFKELKNRPRAHLSFAGQLLQRILKTANTFEKNHLPRLARPQPEHLCQGWPGFLRSREVAPAKVFFVQQCTYNQFCLFTCAKVQCGRKHRKVFQQTGTGGWFGWSNGSCRNPAGECGYRTPTPNGKSQDLIIGSGFCPSDHLVDVKDCGWIKILLRSLCWCRHTKDLFLQSPVSGNDTCQMHIHDISSSDWFQSLLCIPRRLLIVSSKSPPSPNIIHKVVREGGNCDQGLF